MKLIKDFQINEYQKLINKENGMASYVKENYNRELDNSKLRQNAEINIWNIDKALMEPPMYDIDTKRENYCFGEEGKEIIKINCVEKFIVPFFEIYQELLKTYKTIWDIKKEDFIGNNDILRQEDRIYKKIINEIGEKVEIKIIIRTPLTVQPVTDWINKKFGFYIFTIFGIGIFK